MSVRSIRFISPVAGFLLALLLFPAYLFAQNADNDTGDSVLLGRRESRAILALTTPDYPVSPGDVYRLSWDTAAGTRQMALVVQSDLSMNAGVFGRIDVSEMTFPDLRGELRNRVTAAYGGSDPQFFISSLGEYEINVRGAASSTRPVQIDGLTRLSEVFSRRSLDYTSEREVVIVAADGRESGYDLYRAGREGERSEDPFVRPGDAVRFTEADRIVRISGQVRRPGEYQLLPGEDVHDLVERYGDGLSREADEQRVRIVRTSGVAGETSTSILVNLIEDREPEDFGERAEERDYEFLPVDEAGLEDGDLITVPSKEQFRPVAEFEGAVFRVVPGDDPEDQQRLDELRYERFSLAFRDGDMLSDILRENEERFHPDAELSRAYLSREDNEAQLAETIPFDGRALLSEREPQGDIALERGDRIVIPFSEQVAFVTGEGANAGVVPIDGTTRLARVVEERATTSGSVRDVVLERREGGREVYDIFQFQRFGDTGQNPYVRPGDRVEIRRAGRRVSVSGAVSRAGQYQLTEGEDVSTLIEEFAGGFEEDADREEMRIVRIPRTRQTVLTRGVPDGAGRGGEDDPSPQQLTLYFNYEESVRPQLRDRDRVVVETLDRYLPVAVIEGAVSAGGGLESGPGGAEGDGAGSSGARGGHLEYRFEPGIRLREVIEDTQNILLGEADLRHSYIRRAESAERLPVDLYAVLYEDGEDGSIRIESGDRIVIPFRQRYIMVSGAVHHPGPVSYIPDRSWEYYLNQAGGIDPSRRWGRRPSYIRTTEGERRRSGEPLEPEDTMHYRVNNPFHYIIPVATTVSAVVGIFQIIDYLSD